MRPQAEAKTLTWQVCYESDLPETVLTDPVRVGQILTNLIAHAIKVTTTGGIQLIIRYESDRLKPVVRFDVIHSSRALDQQQRDRIFEPFAQAEMSGDDGHSGTGLSLTISRRIARLLGGDITADRDADVGNVFSATIATGSVADVPLVTAPVNEEEDEEEPTTPKSMRALSGARVLLAEDGPDNRRLVTYMLERAGVDVTVADNGQLAIDAVSAAAAGQRSFDVILMDMQMPVLDGYQATQQLRAAGLTTPIIALTAHAMSKDRDKCLQAGCDDYVAKPINRDHLLTLVENCRQAGD